MRTLRLAHLHSRLAPGTRPHALPRQPLCLGICGRQGTWLAAAMMAGMLAGGWTEMCRQVEALSRGLLLLLHEVNTQSGQERKLVQHVVI